ncbi:MAG: hypothetical protein STSR0008_12260 [Ignavibacterium sp.]
MRFVILSEKKWNEFLLERFKNENKNKWFHINNKADFNLFKLNEIKPDKIFIPHWSYIIPKEIFEKYECIVFHMTDLPFGRGGSPLQNLIERGIYKTKISALRVVEELDAGDIYLKKDLELYGAAEEIFLRANDIIFEMINEIVKKDLKPYPQEGKPVIFKRRKKERSSIKELNDIVKIYDYIRMLDAEGYPKAFLDFNDIRIEFSRAQLKADKSVIADVRIYKK